MSVLLYLCIRKTYRKFKERVYILVNRIWKQEFMFLLIKQVSADIAVAAY